ncbi:Polyadenylate-binding protein RBP45B [Zea mays]|uniref:Polyadenylate-binding protein RBP45B n=1 Tax=Zea mays TaxID=4577 RepID=A0A3L6ERA6_MAIZE|nr:Polyadenylate-binding protein RBP45B [Zea mays]
MGASVEEWRARSKEEQWRGERAYQSSQGNCSENDPNNTTVFVGGLDSNVDEEYLRQIFTLYREISYVKIPVGKHCGFVQFTSRSCAEEAIQMLNGSQIGGQKARLSWGCSTQNRQPGNEGYSYGAPNAQDPSIQNYYGYLGYVAIGGKQEDTVEALSRAIQRSGSRGGIKGHRWRQHAVAACGGETV